MGSAFEVELPGVPDCEYERYGSRVLRKLRRSRSRRVRADRRRDVQEVLGGGCPLMTLVESSPSKRRASFVPFPRGAELSGGVPATPKRDIAETARMKSLRLARAACVCRQPRRPGLN